MEGLLLIADITGYTAFLQESELELLEVLTAYQGQGVGTELMKHILKQLDSLYAVDLICDLDLKAFYGRLGFGEATGMIIRRVRRGASS